MPLPNTCLIGGVVTDPEFRFTASGKPLCSFRIAVKGRKKVGDREWADGEPYYLEVTWFDRSAENLVNTVTKGDTVLVNGRLEPNVWTDKAGNERRELRMVAEDVGVSLRWSSWAKTENHAASGAGSVAPPEPQGSGWGPTPGDLPTEPPF